MKLLLDEGVPEELRGHFPGHDVRHVVDMGWRSIVNGELMRLTGEAGFDIFVTVDKNLPYQQNIGKFPFCVAVLDVPNNTVASCIDYAGRFEGAVGEVVAGSVVWVR